MLVTRMSSKPYHGSELIRFLLDILMSSSRQTIKMGASAMVFVARRWLTVCRSPRTPLETYISPAESSNSQAGSTPDSSQSQLARTPPFALPSDIFTFQDFMGQFDHSIPGTIVMAPEFEAIPFFFRNFITLPQQAESMRGYLELLVPLYNRAQPSSALHLATSAVALATCGNYPGRQHLLRDAATTYGKAIRKLNEDLKHPHLARSDQSVLATLLFSLYEVSRLITSARSPVVFLPLEHTCCTILRLIVDRLS